MSNIKARINNKKSVEVKAVSVGTAGRLSDLSDLDMTLIEQGAVLVYDESSGKWRAKKELEDGTSLNGGQY